VNWPKRLDPHPWPNKERPGMHRLARPDSHALLPLFIYFMFKVKQYFTKHYKIDETTRLVLFTITIKVAGKLGWVFWVQKTIFQYFSPKNT
jgi:hypothetical protein